jgi:hypothetical protein
VTWFRVKQPEPQALPELPQQVSADFSQANAVGAI